MIKVIPTAILLVILLFSVACDNALPEADVEDCLFLEDLDYMMWVLESNFPFWGVAYRDRGVDIAEIFDDVRTTIRNADDMTEIEFNNLLIDSFRPLRGIAHFSISRRFREATSDGVPPFAAMLTEEFMVDPNFVRQRLYDLVGQELAELFIEALQNNDVSEIVRLNELVLSKIESRENVNTEIIEDGRIAYLSVASFAVPNYREHIEEQQIFNFFEEIQDFEHLIIDLRRNPGGSLFYPLEQLIRPLVHDTHIVDAFVFVNDSECVLAFAPPDGRWRFMGPLFTEIENELHPIYEMLQKYDLPELNDLDAERLSYGFRVSVRLFPRPAIQSTFTGKIWLLTSYFTGSAAQVATWLFKESGLATLVGDVTAGYFGGTSIRRYLPNTGIPFIFDVLYITDHNGRPLEAGTIPHHFNRPGMDSMETVLALIAEGEY